MQNSTIEARFHLAGTDERGGGGLSYGPCFVDALEQYQLFPERVHQAAGQQTLGYTASVENLHVERDQSGWTSILAVDNRTT